MPIQKHHIKNTLECLFGKDIELTESSPVEQSNTSVVGSYVDGEGKVIGAVIMDLPCACYTAAALSMVPPDIASESISSGVIEDNLRDNVYEVLNVGVSFFSDGTTPDMRLKDMYVGSKEEMQGVSDVLKNAYTELHVDVSISGYGNGASSLYLC